MSACMHVLAEDQKSQIVRPRHVCLVPVSEVCVHLQYLNKTKHAHALRLSQN